VIFFGKKQQRVGGLEHHFILVYWYDKPRIWEW
jgi:hypothetical protein